MRDERHPAQDLVRVLSARKYRKPRTSHGQRTGGQTGVYRRANLTLLTDDPDMLEEFDYYMRALTKYIADHPAEKATKLYRGTKIRQRQKTAVKKTGGAGSAGRMSGP